MSQNMNPLSNGSYWGPIGEGSQEIQLERLFLASGYLTGMGFGMQLMLYFACMRILWRGSKTRFAWFLMGYTSLLCATNVITTVTAYIGVEQTYIDNRNFPGGVVAFITASVVLPFDVISTTMPIFGCFLGDALLLWRVHVIWRASTLTGRAMINLYMIPPGILVLASFAVGLVWDVQSALPTRGFFAASAGQTALAYFSLTLASNVLMTGMIVFRIWGYQRKIRGSLGDEHGTHYTSITTMFVESAALYSIMSILVLGTFAAKSNISQIFLGLTPGIQLISTYFIIWRVAEGRAWSREAVTTTASIIRFNQTSADTQRPTKPGMRFSTNLFTSTTNASSTREIDMPLQSFSSNQSKRAYDNQTDRGLWHSG